MFGLTYPVMSAPMALHSGGALAAAVSAAGGLGSFATLRRLVDANATLGINGRLLLIERIPACASGTEREHRTSC